MNLDDIKYGNTTKEQEAKVKEDGAGILKAAIETGRFFCYCSKEIGIRCE